jgi:signal transduction histidine kinase
MNQNEGILAAPRELDEAQALRDSASEQKPMRPAHQRAAMYRWMAFADPRLEQEYLDGELSSQRKSIIVNIALASLLIAAFSALDSVLLPERVLDSFRVTRYAIQLPLLVLAIVITARAARARPQIIVTIVMMSICQLCWPLLLAFGGEATLAYLSLALMQTMIGTYFMVGLPVRWSIPIVGTAASSFLLTGIIVALPTATIIMYAGGYMTIAVIGGFGAYRVEDASRRRFIAMRRSEMEYRERLVAEAELNRWLAKFADFLRHELKNTIAGVRSSFELVQRSSTSPQVIEYVTRGQRSVAFMQTLLAQVANATSLESALAAQSFERVDLSSLMRELLDDFGTDHTDWRVEERLADGIYITANPDSLVQLFDKLLHNAVAHGDRAWPLQVMLQADGSDAVISLANRGAPLPQPTESVFEPFISGKRERAPTAHLGLGLFVAKTIVTSHRGRIEAASLQDPPGAAFTLRLPLYPTSN